MDYRGEEGGVDEGRGTRTKGNICDLKIDFYTPTKDLN